MNIKNTFKTTRGILLISIALTAIELYSLLTCYITDVSRCGLFSSISFILIPLSQPFFISLKLISRIFGKKFMVITLPFFVFIASYLIINIANALLQRIRKKEKVA